MSYVYICNSLQFFAEIGKEDGDEYEPDSGKENANTVGFFRSGH